MSRDADKPLVTPEVVERFPPEAVEIILRLLARIEEQKLLVLVVRVGHRKDVYR